MYFNNKKLLLVEDNTINQMVAKKVLEAIGFVVDISVNGLEAVAAVQNKNYDIVLMDIQMPIMDGFEATKKIRSLDENYLTLPIIAMTAHSLSGDADTCLNVGMNGYLTKPIEPDKVFKEIGKWVAPTTNNLSSALDNLPSIDKIPNLPGIDVTTGLKRLSGDFKTYQRILVSFRDRYSNAVSEITEHIEQGQWKEAAFIIHSLKGSSGNIGAEQIYLDAGDLEKACGGNDINLTMHAIENLSNNFQPVLKGLNTLKIEEPISTPLKSNSDIIKPVVLIKELNELNNFLDIDLNKSKYLLKSIELQVNGSPWGNDIKDLVYAFNAFDIDTAKEIISDIKKRCLSSI
ncbi:MAG: two-component system sensor histidine kinase/response regulator [Alteromonadaceae bacterium]|jgi:two-component system sensor histidine kinase/response regulator